MDFYLLVFTGTIFVLIGIWPFGPYQLSLIIARRLRSASVSPGTSHVELAGDVDTFAICLCVYNEAIVIKEKVEDLLRLRSAAGGGLDILVYVDGATDETAAILLSYADRIRLTIGEGRRGKTHGMNVLVAQTDASIIMFTDANVRIDPHAVMVLRHYFADETIGCVCSHLTYVNASQSATASVGCAFWSFNEWSKGLETSTGSVIGADGSLFAVRRQLHNPVPKGLFDDIFVSLGVLLAGYRVVHAPELRAYESHATEPADEFRRKVMISCECMHIHFELWPRLRRMGGWNLYKYVAHRFLRWVGGYFLVVGTLLLTVAAVELLGTLFVVIAASSFALTLAAATQARIGVAMKFTTVLLAFAANIIGSWLAVSGKRAITWEPPSSARVIPIVQVAASSSSRSTSAKS